MYRIIQKCIELELNKEDKKPNILKHLEEYNNVFVTGDLHFFHTNILKYEPLRQEQLVKLKPAQYINEQLKLACINPEISKSQLIDDFINEHMNDYYNEAILEHNEALKQIWNNTIKENDAVIILGDFSLGNTKDTMEILNQLNGHKILIKGNHDLFLKS